LRTILAILLALPAAAAAEPRPYLNQNYAHAVKALRLAEKGDFVAQYDFALMCERGEGLPQNHAEAVKWFRLSAAQDYAPAQLFLGLMYASGKGVTKDNKESLKWLHLAAEQDDITAQFYLGGVYFSSTTVQQDYVQAYKWFTLAGRKDPSRPETLEALVKRMTPGQLAEAQQQVKSWTPRKSK